MAFDLVPLPEFPAYGFQDFSRYLEFFVLEDVYFRAVVIQESLDTSREAGHCVKFVYSELSFFIAVI